MIIPITDLVEASGGRMVEPPAAEGHGGLRNLVRGVSIDSRRVAPGELFVAIVAERDGHEFVAPAARMGAAAALVTRPQEADLLQIVVPDTLVALASLGRLARGRLDGAVIGITGSVGKTSTKDLLASICARAGVTTASERSLNNEMGVPLTLLNADELSERIVVEMGARGAGHIASLCEIASPTVGVVTAVAAAHTEMFGSLDAVAEAKGELVEALPVSGTAVLNAADPRVLGMAGRCAGSVVTFGDGGGVRAADVRLGDDLRPSFRLDSPWGSVDVSLAVAGEHNVSNALAAASAALVTGVSLDDVVLGCADASLSPSRMELARLASGGLVLDDAYNANPASMRAALAALGRLDVGRRVAVLGLMAELGDDAAREHAEIAALAEANGVELVAVGTDLYGVAALPDVDALLDHLPPPVEGEAVLLKASRVVGLDRVARHWHRGGPQGG